MRALVIGQRGQVALALGEAAPGIAVLRGRPAADLTRPDTLAAAIAEVRPQIVINAAAYTAVDAAETDCEAAAAVNGAGAGYLADAAARAGLPLIHLSTDYVFDGAKPSAYLEEDRPNPVSVYGATKLAGEEAVARHPQHVILRTSWIFSQRPGNFLTTMLRLAGQRDTLRVVDDQFGCPSFAGDIAAGVLTVAAAAVRGEGRWGTFHLAAAGATSWCGFAGEIMHRWAALGGPSAQVTPIATADYPTAARRPANSRLDCDKIMQAYGVRLPPWQDAVPRCLALAKAGGWGT